jgi:protein-tyrosine phosphatase
MKTQLFWIPTNSPGRIAIAPRPRGGDWLEDEVSSWRDAGADVVVSLLEPEEIAQFELSQEESLCQAHGMQFLSFPIADRSVPSSHDATIALFLQLANSLAEGKGIVIPCRQGIGRAALIAIGLLVITGINLESAIQRVSEARGCPVPETAEQKQWIKAFAKAGLGMLAT